MFRIKKVISPSLKEAVFLTVFIILFISISIIKFDATPHIPILFSSLLLMVYGLIKKIPYKKLEEGLVDGARSGMAAVFLFFFIGILISSWMMSGTIPTLIYAGFNIITPIYFLAVIFIVTSIIGISIGSSLTTVATVGVAFIGMADAMDISLAMTAGAIVSGAFFGDKMSPLSDTTNLASTILNVDLFEHIRNMGWTTIPAFFITSIIFAMLSPNITTAALDRIDIFKEGLLSTGLVHWYAIIPLIILLIMSMMKIPALLTLATSSISAILLSFLHERPSMSQILDTLYNGYTSNIEIEAIDSLLTRGGLDSMLFTVGIVLLALSMGGLLFTLGIVQTLLQRIEKLLRKTASVITTSALTAIGINILIGEQYLSVLLTGEAFQSQYEKVGLANKNLSRVLEDAGTVINPLIPWGVCGVFITKVLGVPTLDYLPFAFFCLLSPILTIFYGMTGKTLTYIDRKAAQ